MNCQDLPTERSATVPAPNPSTSGRRRPPPAPVLGLTEGIEVPTPCQPVGKAWFPGRLGLVGPITVVEQTQDYLTYLARLPLAKRRGVNRLPCTRPCCASSEARLARCFRGCDCPSPAQVPVGRALGVVGAFECIGAIGSSLEGRQIAKRVRCRSKLPEPEHRSPPPASSREPTSGLPRTASYGRQPSQKGSFAELLLTTLSGHMTAGLRSPTADVR